MFNCYIEAIILKIWVAVHIVEGSEWKHFQMAPHLFNIILNDATSDKLYDQSQWQLLVLKFNVICNQRD